LSPRATQLAFIDVEASGLNEGSFPIEIGWAVLGGTAGGLLIQPDATWSPDAWDGLAEEQHGISRTALQELGLPAGEVVECVNQLLPAGTLALTDAFEWDSYWVERLFDVATQARRFQLGDFWRSLAIATDPVGVAAARRLDATIPRAHRARQDAEHLRDLWIRCVHPT
jgi:hypothetical protein